MQPGYTAPHFAEPLPIENGIFDLLPGMDFDATIEENSSYLGQSAEVSVLQSCRVAHPLSDTTVQLDGISTGSIQESEVPQWIRGLDVFNIVQVIVHGINDLVQETRRTARQMTEPTAL